MTLNIKEDQRVGTTAGGCDLAKPRYVMLSRFVAKHLYYGKPDPSVAEKRYLR